MCVLRACLFICLFGWICTNVFLSHSSVRQSNRVVDLLNSKHVNVLLMLNQHHVYPRIVPYASFDRFAVQI